MERLTERELNVMGCASYTKCNTDECVGYCGGCNAEEEAKLKLKEYEDLEEQDVPDTNVGKWISCSERMPENKCHNCFGAANNDCRFCEDDGK